MGQAASVALKSPRNPRSPKITVMYITPSARIDGRSNSPPLRCSIKPIITAMGICTTHGKIAAGYCLNTAAITKPKMASTTVSAMNKVKRNNNRTRLFSKRPAMSPTVWPLLRRLTTKAPKSCTAPMRMEPNTTQSSAGTQPHMIAIAGPTIGPVPAIEVKWCPKTTDLRVGT